jgi:hypothetical protein
MDKSVGERVVARYRDGKLAKGYVKDFSVDSDTIILIDPKKQQKKRIAIDELKAVYFVKTFEGVSRRIERKAFGIRKSLGRKVFIKFRDTESVVGFIPGEIPWDKGFSLAKLGKKARGFFIIPADGDSNNIKVFVVGSEIRQITIMV